MHDTQDTSDPYLWLEEVQGERALAWVRDQNARSRARLEAFSGFAALRAGFQAVLDSKDQIPHASRRGDWFYNLWRDAEHPRGLWRRATWAEYQKKEPAWQVLIDLDALGRAEGENWVWKGATCLAPRFERCLVSLSRGGADAAVVREFDIATGRFVEGGFALPEAKSQMTWIDIDTVYVGTDFGPGSLTDAGYVRVLKRWRRGQPLADAQTVYEGQAADVAVSVSVDPTPGFERTVFERAIDFYRSEQFLLVDGALHKLDKPDDASISFWREHLLLELRSDWQAGDAAGQRWPRGSLLTTDAAAYLRGERRLQALFTPTATRSLAGWSTTRSQVLVNLLDNVASRVEAWQLQGGQWRRRALDLPFPGTLHAGGLHSPFVADDPLAEAFSFTYTDFLTPDSLMQGSTDSAAVQVLKSRPAFFDAGGMKVEQHFATSKDGTRVPYFVVWPKGAMADGRNPTLLYGYGGFEVSLQPWYSGTYGQAWFQRGGVLVVANIRGGGEYGPGWHQAATLANKMRSYEDFAAVAEDLATRKVTSAAQLAIEGGSNGGLLVGAVMLQRPELFKAVVCQVPLLDMRRYHKLLAGASWMAEYGNPDDPQDWALISRYSPYQNLQAGRKLPTVLFTTSTRDDRVHPGHARKMAARMAEQGHAMLYYENIEGGHGGAADNAQRADMMALEFSFLWQQLAP